MNLTELTPNCLTAINEMDPSALSSHEVRTLYEQCDPDGRGYITREDFDHLQGHVQLDRGQLDEVFAILDKDQQGRVTMETFTRGFGQLFGQTANPVEMATEAESDHESDTQLDQAIQASGAEILLKDYEQVGRIWKELHHSNPSLLPQFEKMLATIANEIRTVRTEYENMETVIQTKLNQQEQHLTQLLEEMEQQLSQDKERLLEEERNKERQVRESLTNELRLKENMTNELLQQYEQARSKLDEVERTRMNTIQEKERLQEEKSKLEKRLSDTEAALNECKEYIEMLQKKAREDRRTRAKAAIELSETIALERENLVRQLDALKSINQKLMDDREQRHQHYLGRSRQEVEKEHPQCSTEDGSLDVTSPVTSENDVESEADRNRLFEENVNPMPDWASLRVNSCKVESRGAEAARRGSILGAYFNAGPEHSSTETELEGIAETDEDEDVFSSGVFSTDCAQECRVGSLSVDPVSVDQQKVMSLGNENSVPNSNSDVTLERRNIAQRVYKVVFIGDSAVGKSCIIKQLVHGRFDSSISLTVAVDFHTKLMQCDDDTNAILQLWDTAGQERFKGITWKFFRRADAAVVVYDVTREDTLISVRKWVQSVLEGANDDVLLMILSNKHDQFESLEDKRKQLMRKSFQELVKNYSAIGFEVSAVTGENIQTAFSELARLLKTKEDESLKNTIELRDFDKSVNKKKKGCCG